MSTSDKVSIVSISGRLLNAEGKTVSTSRCGKDTVANTLSLYHDFARLALSDSIQTTLGVDLNGHGIEILKKLEERGVGWRPALKHAGTECRRKVRSFAVWRQMIRTKIAILLDLADIRRFAVSGVRYPEELADLAVVASLLGGRFVHVEVLRTAPGVEAETHSSDVGLEKHKPHVTLFNNSSKRDLIWHAERFGTQVLGGDYDSTELPSLAPAKSTLATVWDEAVQKTIDNEAPDHIKKYLRDFYGESRDDQFQF